MIIPERIALVGQNPNGPPRPLWHGMALWNTVTSEYSITDCGGRELLCQACSALDRAEALAEAIAKDGVTFTLKGGIPKSHPGCKDELAARAFICKTLERLGISVEALKPRPGRGIGWTPGDAA